MIVLDASVALKWFFKEPGTESAMSYLKSVLENPDKFIVPELFFHEVSNTLNRLIEDDSDDRLLLFQELLTLGINRVPFGLFDSTRKFHKLGLSGYDSAYLALAKHVDGTWVTADEKAYRKVKHHGNVELLDD